MRDLSTTIVTLALACGGCAQGDTQCPVGTLPAGDGCVVVAGDATRASDAASPGDDAGAGCNPLAADPLDGLDQNCDGVDGDPATQLFVSPFGDDTNAGTPSSPFRTLGAALAAHGPGIAIVLAAGTYPEDIDADLVGRGIFGGYDAHTWTTTEHRSVVLGANASPILTVPPAGSVTVERLEVRGRTPAEPGGSSIALRLTGDGSGTAHVVDSRLFAERGQEGEAGTDGAAGTPGSNGIDGQRCLWDDGLDCTGSLARASAGVASVCGPSTASGAGGGSRLAGARSASGSAGGVSGAGVVATEGGDGEPGLPGAAGLDGATGAGLGTFSVASYEPPAGHDGTAGTAGGGGGGGGGGASRSGPCSAPYVSVEPAGSAGGSGGAGGCGAAPGAGGGGGGASVGLIAEGVRIVLDRSHLETAGGGRGGAGGNGGTGGVGGAPGAGGASACGRDGVLGYAGGDGGSGGDGGAGGHGAGGAGGPSVGVVLLGGAALETTESTITVGPAGAGGSSDGSAGQPGLRTETLSGSGGT